GTLGVDTQAIDASLAKALELPASRGALVTRVMPDSGAAKAGLEVGDLVVAANGERIDSPAALHNFEGLQPIGAVITLDILRDGEPRQLQARLQDLPRSHAGSLLDPRLAGAVFAELPERLRQGGVRGVQVESVERGSRAAANGLRQGDLVVATTGGRVDDLAAFRASLPGTDVRLLLQIVRGDAAGTLTMQ